MIIAMNSRRSSVSRPLSSKYARWATAVVAASALLGSGCVSKPTMQVRDVRITGLGFLGVGLDTVVQVRNRNSFDIQLRAVRVRVTLAGRYVIGPIETRPDTWLRAGTSTELTTPVIIPWNYVAPLLAETLGRESIDYRVEGNADITATQSLGIRANNERVDESGTVPRERILAAARLGRPDLR